MVVFYFVMKLHYILNNITRFDKISFIKMISLLKKDVEFHECIFKAANNQKLHQLINSLWEQVYRFRFTYVSDYDSTVNIIEEHKMILEAIKKGDSELAKKYAKDVLDKGLSDKVFG